ncbi:MAG: hypothetical protein GX051_06190 [Clostridiales bacterium]|nr:hypothetical protein [Clostridiales bacterium]
MFTAKRKILCFSVIVTAVIGVILCFLITKGLIVFDHTAEKRDGGIYWNDTMYVSCYGKYTEWKTIAKTKDGWHINAVKEDSSNTFIVARSFLDQELFVKSDYTVPVSGEITTVFWGGNEIKNTEFINAVSKILENAVSDFEYETEAIYSIQDNQKMRDLYIGYNGCPVGTYFAGYMGIVNDKWCITTEISDEQHNADGSSKPYTVWCYCIPQEYSELLEKSFE